MFNGKEIVFCLVSPVPLQLVRVDQWLFGAKGIGFIRQFWRKPGARVGLDLVALESCAHDAPTCPQMARSTQTPKRMKFNRSIKVISFSFGLIH